jgi:hypothetical protein
MSPVKKNKSHTSITINHDQYNELMRKLDTLIKVTAAGAFHGEEITKGIVSLSSSGLTSKEVAEILGTTDGYVRNIKSQTKKLKRKDGIEEVKRTDEEQSNAKS